MPNINEMMPSKYLKKEDVGIGVLWQIRGVEQQDISMEDSAEELRWVVIFEENTKPLIMNKTNLRAIAAITGSENTDGWVGKQVVLYNDPTIQFRGEVIGGIRIRAPKTQQEQELPF